jgi:hypothetical protein
MVFTRSGRGGYPGNTGRGGGIRGHMTPPRRRRSLSPTQFRFLYPATPLGSPGPNPIQPQLSQTDQAPQQAVSPQTSQPPVTSATPGIKKIYYWCDFHSQWTRHEPSECKKLPIKTREQRSTSKSDYRQKKQAYMEAKATLQQFNISSDSKEEETPQLFHDSDSDSNVSDSTEYFSEAEDSNMS